jgi:hypothetical protein
MHRHLAFPSTEAPTPESGSRPVNMKVLGYALFIGAVYVRALAGWRIDFERMEARRIGCGKRDLGGCWRPASPTFRSLGRDDNCSGRL